MATMATMATIETMATMATMDADIKNQMVIDSQSNKYNRSNSTAQIALEKKMSVLYATPHVLITPSGMNAIYLAIHAVTSRPNVAKRLNLFYAQELYCDTHRLFWHMSAMDVNGTTIVPHDFNTATTPQLPNEDNILYFETCSNPNGHIFDFSMMPQLRAMSRSLIVVVDNTWVSSYAFNPLQHDADVVVTSLTKYYGAGSAIAGAAMFRDKTLLDLAELHSRVTGIHVSPFNVTRILANIDTLGARLERSAALTVAVIVELLKIPVVMHIAHTSLQSHNSYTLAQKYFRLQPSVLTFSVVGKVKRVKSVMSKLQILDNKTSFGATMSRLDPWPQQEGNCVVCRLSIGYEDTHERIVSGLSEFLSALSP